MIIIKIKHHFITIILGLLVVITPIVGEGSNTSATNEVFLTIAERFFQPTMQEFSLRTIKLEPFMLEKTIYGKSYSFYITVDSLIDIPQQIQVYPVKLAQELDGSHLFITGLWWGSKLFNITPSNFTLDSKKSKMVKVDFKVPKEIVGGFYSAIVFETNPIINDNKEYKIASAKTGVILAFTLPGELKREGKITDISFLQDKPQEPIIIILTFINTGNIHLRLWGNITIRNQFGLEIANVPIKSGVSIPGHSYQLKAEWKPQNLAVGTYTAQANIEIEYANPMKVIAPFIVIRPNEIGIIKLEIVSFTIPIAIQNKPIHFNLLVFNAGNIELTIIGEVIVKNIKDEVIATTPFEKEIIPAGSSKELSAILKEGCLPGSYTAYATVKYNGKIKTATQNFFVIEK